MEDGFYWFWLQNVHGVGAKKAKVLLEYFGNPKDIFKASEKTLEHVVALNEADRLAIVQKDNIKQIQQSYELLEKKGIGYVYLAHEDYPKRLKEMYDAPIGLFYRGKLPPRDTLAVAIVGARNCTEYGKYVGKMLGEAFANMGISVISGLAAGIDAAGHAGCIEKGGYTCGVLGCGVDICYPQQNFALYEKMIQTGCVLSEYIPGTKPFAGQFPVRNRIISGLSDVVIVVEARKRSGSLITVEQALEQNKEVMAVPGRIGDALSEGCNELLQMGAMMMLRPQDILMCSAAQQWKRELELKEQIKINTEKSKDFSASQKEKMSNQKTNVLASPQNIVYSLINLFPISVEHIIEETQLSLEEVLQILVQLQLEGLVREISNHNYVRNV